MGFWKKVEIELDYYGLSRKELSAKSGVPMTTINRAIERDSNPFALDALRISKALGVSLEYLLDFSEKEQQDPKSNKNELHQIEMYKKYHTVINLLESFTPKKQKTVIGIMNQIADL